MQELSPFHHEILIFLRKQGSQPVPDGDVLLLSEIISTYQHLFGASGASLHIEKLLLDAFPQKDFIDLGLFRYYPRIYRGLPRLYHRSTPTQSHVKQHFTHLPSLKRQALVRALFSLYAHCPAKGRVAVLTSAMAEGFGDYAAAADTVRILRSRFPALEVSLVALVPTSLASRVQGEFIIPYEGESPSLSAEALEHLRAVDLVLQLPTSHFPPDVLQAKRMERVGEYGWIESDWFHPSSGGYAMGLHFLEKGILIRKLKQASWGEVKNEMLLRWRSPENHFYLAYLSSPMGGAIYLHALLKGLENDERGIDLCVPDLGWFIEWVERQRQKGKSILEWELGVGSFEVVFQDRLYAIAVGQPGKKGKRVRLICPGTLDPADFQRLLLLSGPFVAVRSNQTVTEAISAGKPFFYDGREHARYFFQDLVALAENRIASHPSALDCIRGMHEAFLYGLPAQEGEWVDETFFQEIGEWPEIALKIGFALQDLDVVEGFQKLSQIVSSEYSANHFLCHLVQRALCHAEHPEMAIFEEEEVSRFISGSQTFTPLIQAIVKKVGALYGSV